MDRRSVPYPCVHAYQDEAVLWSILVGPLVTRLAVRRLFKEAKPPYARAHAGHLREPRRAAMNAAQASSCFLSTRRPLGPPSTLPRPHRSSKHRALSRTSLLLTGMLAAMDTAAARR
jgi:hypothetical protein